MSGPPKSSACLFMRVLLASRPTAAAELGGVSGEKAGPAALLRDIHAHGLPHQGPEEGTV
jgi:hypothetical protein